ncbi:MAG: hypothetical protein IID03_11450 [Candidatus Dadabacteria bacterium]|nr:hypothetical protein [Candidatus Dadabacteria bacterium]
MAKIKFGGPIMDARGKIAGLVFSANTHGAYIRRKVTPVNPATVAQLLVRSRFTTNSQAWRNLTDDERKGFIEQKDNFKTTDIFGDLKSPTGQNLFIKLNQNILQISETPITAVPLPEDVPGFTSLVLVADTGGGTLTLTFDPAIDAAVKVLVTATAPLSPGVNFVKADFRIVAVLDSAESSPKDLAAEYIVKNGALPQVGAKIFVQMRPINISSGIPGSLIKASDIAI